MAFVDFPEQSNVVRLLQRSLESGRLAHAYLFTGMDEQELAAMARTLAKAINCLNPPRRGAGGLALDSCDACANCRKIEEHMHPDVHWIRPESKSRVIKVEQVRELMQTIYLKPTQALYKVSVIVAADRLNEQAANAFLKTLEEPPSNSILILLTTESERLLETIRSRCLRLRFSGLGKSHVDEGLVAWLTQFSEMASVPQKSLLGRYKLLSVLLARLTALKETISDSLTKNSPLEKFDDIDPKLRDKWEDELAAAIEAEYRRQRAEVLSGVQWWMRDIWLLTLQFGANALTYPQLSNAASQVATRISSSQAVGNLEQLEKLQKLLTTNVQEALALEVGLLKLKL